MVHRLYAASLALTQLSARQQIDFVGGGESIMSRREIILEW
jgi:hypothetical protein